MDKESIKQRTIQKLLDQYEKSKTFIGQNLVNQTFSKRVGELFPKYQDDAEYEYFCDVNEALQELEKQGFISLNLRQGSVLEKVILNTERLDECYRFLNRLPKKEENEFLLDIFGQYVGNQILNRYFEVQRVRIGKNQKVEYFDGSKKYYSDLILMCKAVLENEEEIYIRDFSIRLFRDSKRAEALTTKVQALLFQYGEEQFAEKETVLEECGVVRTPTYICMKGNAEIVLKDQSLDLSKMHGDIAFSTASLKEVLKVKVLGKRVITIENLTSFHDYGKNESEDLDNFVIYLGGFHNRTKREFLKFIYQSNKDKEYRHFGDIDAGGFYILEHLKRKTGIPFRSMHMNIAILKAHMCDTKALSENDKKRIQKMLEMKKREAGESGEEDYSEVLKYMLEHDCKLEQEAVTC